MAKYVLNMSKLSKYQEEVMNDVLKRDTGHSTYDRVVENVDKCLGVDTITLSILGGISVAVCSAIVKPNLNTDFGLLNIIVENQPPLFKFVILFVATAIFYYITFKLIFPKNFANRILENVFYKKEE